MRDVRDRLIAPRLAASRRSVLLLGPRQVGKSTLCATLGPNRTINLADEEVFLEHARDPGLLRRTLATTGRPRLILLDEIQRLPGMLNTVQALIDEHQGLRFLITGSSARKLKRGRANLLPGRILVEHLDPLSVLELGNELDLDRALRLGMLPGIYLDPAEGQAVLDSYARVYLREEIQAEALTRNLGGFARFLDTAAAVSGSWINYSKLASDAEIPKETIRRFFALLEETLLIFRLPPYEPARATSRRIGQRDRFLFFDVGVRNALLGLHRRAPTRDQVGGLFEQWLIGQIVYLQRALAKDWRLSSYRTQGGAEVDLVLEAPGVLAGIEVKASRRVAPADARGLASLAELVPRRTAFRGYIAYTGDDEQRLARDVRALPYRKLLEHLATEL